MTPADWDQLARTHANAIAARPRAARRGAYPAGRPGACVAYAADDLARDPVARMMFKMLRQYLLNFQLVELGSGAADDGRAWTIVVQTEDAKALAEAVQSAWRCAYDVLKGGPTPTTKHGWDALARENANLLRRDGSDRDRGAFHTPRDGVCVAFASDDFAHDDRARLEVTILRQHLDAAGLVELGFATSDDGRAWCMAVQTDDDEALTDAVWDAWRIAFDVKPHQ